MTGTPTAQRMGFALTLVESAAFAAGAVVWTGALGGAVIASAAILDSFVAFALVLAVLAPGPLDVRVERVLTAQILAVVGLLLARVAVAEAGEGASDEVAYLVKLALALAAIALVIWPPPRTRRLPRATWLPARPVRRSRGCGWTLG